MDPFTATILVALAVAGVGFGVANIPYFMGKKYLKDKKKASEAQAAREKDPEYQKEMVKKREFTNSIDKKQTIPFFGVRNNKDVVEMHLREEFQFDIDRDVVLKGRLRCVDENNQKVDTDVYLYQPRLFASSVGGQREVCIGPKLKNNKLNSKYMYITKVPGKQNEIYYSYVPKADIATGDEYDFDKDNPYNGNNRILNYINITFDYDEAGNLVPVDLKNAEERQKVLAYIQKYRNTNVLENYVRVAKRKMEADLEKERMERLREDMEYKAEQKAASQANREEKNPEKVPEKDKDYYDFEYGVYGKKNLYRTMAQGHMPPPPNGRPPMGPPPEGPQEHHGPRR